jgi:DNA-binding transcriptional regulator PaaX
MRSHNKSIEDNIFDLFSEPVFKYKGVPVNIFGLPVFQDYKKQSVRNTLSRLSKNEYIYQKGDHLTISLKGQKYISEKASRLKFFDSPFSKDDIKNLLVIFDIPEDKKSYREWFRAQLKSFGYEMIQRSVWVGPSPLPKEFSNYLKFIRLEKCIKTFKLAKSTGYKS